MSNSIKSKKIIASVLALSIITAGVSSSEASIIKSIIPVNTISADAASSYGDWEYTVLNDGTAKIVKYKGNSSRITIPSSVRSSSNEYLTVTALENYLFENNKSITSVTVPSGIKEIPHCCFNGASNLTSVSLPYGLTALRNCAFAGTGISSISLPSSVTRISYRAFYNTNLTSVSLPDNAYIDSNAFESCKKLKTVNLPNNLQKVIGETFLDCTSLESITIPSSVTFLCKRAFANCTSLKTISIPNSVTYFGECLFQNCSNLKSVTIPASVNDFDASLFEGCSSLENINIANPNVFETMIIKHSLKGSVKLTKINNESIVSYRSKRYSRNAEPYFNAKYSDMIYEYFDIIDSDRLPFFEEYLKADIKYIVATNTNSQQTDAEKVKALHDWVCNKVEYAWVNNKPDPSDKSHGDASVFMSNTAVCEGYAKALALLLQEAGVKAYYVSGDNHAWNMVKIGDHYFHFDATHDDDPRDYDHFLKSDNDLIKCGAGHYDWKFEIPNTSRVLHNYPSYMPECKYSVGDANMDGFINKDDLTTIQRYLLGIEDLPGTDTVLADANLDGQIDMSDVVKLIQQYHIY